MGASGGIGPKYGFKVDFAIDLKKMVDYFYKEMTRF
jgi:hypothetical protein